jgi:glutamate/tyrosine decarboxylase-like PLP-dependent enzyme
VVAVRNRAFILAANIPLPFPSSLRRQPYDTGIFLCRDLAIQTQAFRNPNAAYLSAPSTGAGVSQISSPLNVGIENSRRFRALPVYAMLRSEGSIGLADMFARMVRLARGIAEFVRDSDDYEWLPSEHEPLERTHIIVLFRARDAELNAVLVERINETRKMYVSGTSWSGQKAVRVAVSSWRVDVERDLAVVKEVLSALAKK